MQMHAQIIRRTCAPVSEIRRRTSLSSVHADIKLVCNSRSAGGSLVCVRVRISLWCARVHIIWSVQALGAYHLQVLKFLNSVP